jgi:K(+)-stimulated pyrophosphate-energized sodium pump
MLQVELLVWIFVMRILMVITSVIAYLINAAISDMLYKNVDELDFEVPLTRLVWITSILSIIVTFIASYFMIPDINGNTDMWWILSIIISCGTIGAALIPEFTKIFTSTKSTHVKEIVQASKEGGASLTILAGLVSGNFSAFWTGLVFFVLMFIAYFASTFGLSEFMLYPSIFAFGLVAFGMLGMGPVTIAVDSYGPVTDNAQSIYELSLIEDIHNIDEEIEKDFGFKPDWEKSKAYLEENDGAGNTFKASAKPVLIGTAVVGATTMIFSLILMIKSTLGIEPETVLNLLNPYTILGFILGGTVIYWFTGASIQAVSTGAYRAVAYIKKNINLDPYAPKKADVATSIEVVKICTRYAQKGMFNIFIAVFFFALAFACFSSPSSIGGNNAVALFVSYLISIAVFGLFQAIFMANAGGAWDNAKKLVESDRKQKGTPLHDAVVIGDTVGDPFKDTSSVALNPIIKFTTLFGLLAMEIAISETFRDVAPYAGLVFVSVALVFVYRSFFAMRIDKKE